MRLVTTHIAVLIAAATLTLECGDSEGPAKKKAIEEVLNERAGTLTFQTGKMRLSDPEVTLVKQWQAAGLITLRQIPEAYWDSFLSRTQGMGTPVEVTATPKLKNIAMPTSGKTDPPIKLGVLQVRISEDRVDQVTTDEDYKGPLAVGPGERYRIVLGTFRDKPTPAAAVVGMTLSTQDEKQLRFRAVLKYDQFTKRWIVLALDFGDLNSEAWRSNNVK